MVSGVPALPEATAAVSDAAIEAFVQRRGYARVHAPVGLPFTAEFTLGGRLRVLGVDDLARGGIGLRASPTQAALLYVGRRLPRVWLELGPRSGFLVELEVRSRRVLQTFLLGQQYVVGCRFAGLSAQAEAVLARALAELEAPRPAAAPTPSLENP